MSSPAARRTYRSPRRTAAAAATRSAVLDAALHLFIERGYASTTIDAIAGRANVSPKTVYALVRNRRGLLKAVLDRAIAGDEAPVAIADRPWVARLRAAPDPAERLAILGREGARILQRRAADDPAGDAPGPGDAAVRDGGARRRDGGHRVPDPGP